MTEELDENFLDHLAASCNVTHAAQEAGFSREAYYARRRRDPAFAERWQDALAQGYARLEAALVKAAIDRMEGRPPDPDTPFPPMTVQDAIAIECGPCDAIGEALH